MLTCFIDGENSVVEPFKVVAQNIKHSQTCELVTEAADFDGCWSLRSTQEHWKRAMIEGKVHDSGQLKVLFCVKNK